MLCTVAFLAFAHVSLAEDLPPGWGNLAARAEGFAITIPNDFKRQQLTQKGPDDKDVKITIYRGALGGDSYIVAISEFSTEYIKQPTKIIFDNARNGSIERSGGKLVREKDIKVGEHPGRDIVVAAGNMAGYVRARVYVANDRQYAVMLASKTEAALESPDAKRFFDSFKVLKIEPPAKRKK